MSTRHHWADIFTDRRKGPDERKGSATNATAIVRPGERWAPPGCTFPVTHYVMKTSNHTIPDRSPPGSTRTAPSVVHQDGGVKYATGASPKIRGRDNITIGTWHTRTLKAAEKLPELTHEMDRYRWNILGHCEMRWKNFGETTAVEEYKVFFGGKEVKREQGVGFLVHKDIENTVMGCRQSPAGSSLFA